MANDKQVPVQNSAGNWVEGFDPKILEAIDGGGGSGGGAQQHQLFLESGTFTPSQALLDKGGWVDVEVRGAGGRGGAPYGSDSRPGGGGSSGCLTKAKIQVIGPVAVVVGAGSTGGTGGSSSFGTVEAKGGHGGGNATSSADGAPAVSAGEGSNPGTGADGGPGTYAGGYRMSNINPVPGGGGGGRGRAGTQTAAESIGASGQVLVSWVE